MQPEKASDKTKKSNQTKDHVQLMPKNVAHCLVQEGMTFKNDGA